LGNGKALQRLRENEIEMLIIDSDGVRTHVAVKTMWTDYSSLVHKNIENTKDI
jgi:hypothetical protein